MRLAFDIFPADDVRGTRLVRLEGDDYLQGTMFRTELVGMGRGRLVVNVHQSFVNATNFARDNYVEVFDLELSGSYSLGAFFLEEGDFDALSSREQSGRILTFEGRGELSYLSRGILGPTALSAAHGPLDQHWIDTLGSWKWGSLGSETYGGILRRIIYESALMTPDPLPEIQLVDINWDDVVDYNAVPWPGFTGEYDIPVGTNLLQAAADLLKQGIELVANADFQYYAYNAGTYGTDRTSATFATNKVRFQAGVNIGNELSRAVHGATDASHALLKDRTGLHFEVITSPSYVGGDVIKYVGIESPENTGPEDLAFLGQNVLTNRRAYVDQFSFPHPTDYVPLQGLYVPGPPASAAHYWKGDYVTLHTGTSPYDANEQTIRVAAIEWNVDEAGNWLPTVELGAQYLSIGEARFANQLTTLVSSPHAHPPNPELCRAGATGSIGELVEVAEEQGATPGTAVEIQVDEANLLMLAFHGTDNAQVTASTWHDRASGGGTNNSLTQHTEVTTSSDHDLELWYKENPALSHDGGSYVSATEPSGSRFGNIITTWRGYDAASILGSQTAVGTTAPSMTVTGLTSGQRVLACLSYHAGTSGDTINNLPAPTGWTEITQVHGSGVHSPGIHLVQKIATSSSHALTWATIPNMGSSGWSIIAVVLEGAGSVLDGPVELIGTSQRASRCDHRHDLHRDTEPTVDDDEEDGYRVGLIWAVLDDLTTPTAIESVWILADATAGAAVWLELPTGGAGGTIAIEDEGSAEGDADTIDFTGAGVSVTFSGGQATVDIPGGSFTAPVAAKIIRTANASAGSDYGTTSATLVDVDATNLTLNITTQARRVMVGVTGIGFNTNAAGRIDLAFKIDGSVPNGAFINVSQHSEVSNNMNISFVFLTDVLTAASHAFVLQYARGGAGTGTLGASSTNPLCFWVAETMITT